MQYHVSKDFLSLHFAVGQVLSISGYDLEKGRMPCKQIYLIIQALVDRFSSFEMVLDRFNSFLTLVSTSI